MFSDSTVLSGAARTVGRLMSQAVLAGTLVAWAGASAFAQTVTLTDTGAGTSTDLYVGDTWSITLTGTVGAEISINGADTTFAITSSGSTTFTGTITEGSEGYNSQYWTVGGVAASPSPLSFTVHAAPTGTCGDAIQWSGPYLNS